MKKIFSFLLLACMTLGAVAQTKPQAMKSLMEKERLTNTLYSWKQSVGADAKLAPAKLAGLDTTEVYFESFYDDPFYTPVETIVDRRGDTVVTGGDWYVVLSNERYQFIFDIYGGVPETLAGTYTEKNLDEWFSWCMFPEANGDTHYYKTCELTITEEQVSDAVMKYVLEAVVLATCGIGGEEYGYFKISAEHQMVKPKGRWDVAILNCTLEAEEDRVRIYGQDDTIAVDLTFFTELGIEGYYSHKLMDTENSKIVHRGVEREISELEGIITSAETKTGGMAYVFMFEALTKDAYFYNVAMEAPIVPTDTVEISCLNTEIDDSWGMTDATIIIQASNSSYEILAAYNDTKISAPKSYGSDKSAVELKDLKANKDITSMQCNLTITGNKLKGYEVDIKMLGNDHKYYIMHLVNKIPEIKETVELNFTESAKAMFYIDALGSKELQLANYDGEYSVSFDFPFIDQVMNDQFGKNELFMEQTFLVHHTVNGDESVTFATIEGEVWQENDSTFLTATVLGFNGVQYVISMFHTIPTPTEVVTYTFDGINKEEVEFTNALSSGIFVLDGVSSDGSLMAKVNVERITTKTVEGTFYNDGKFEHTDFYAPDTYVKVWNKGLRAYEEFSVQKGTMTVKVENNVLTAVASFICDNGVQYDLTFKCLFARERIPFDTEDGEMDYTFDSDAEIIVGDFVEGYGIVQLIIADADYAVDFYFFADAMDSEIYVPAGVYPINASYKAGSALACKGILPDGPAQSYFCALDADGNLDPLGLYCLVDGTVTVKKIDGKLSVEVDAINSYEVPVKIHYSAAGTAVDNVTVDNSEISKRIVNGQLVIIRNGEIYNATGVKL